MLQNKRSIYIDNTLSQDPVPDELVAYQIKPPTNKRELWHYVYRVFGVAIPRAKICDRCTAPFDAFAEAYFAEYPTVVWRACVPETTSVYTPCGAKSVKDLNPGDEVWGWSLQNKLITTGVVKAKWSSGVKETVKLITRCGEVICTPDHRVLVAKPKNTYQYFDPEWVEAKDVTVKDCLIRPFGHDAREEIILPSNRIADKDICRLAGLILADGSVQHYKIIIAHHKDATYMDWYLGAIKRLFNKECPYYEDKRSSYIHSLEAANECRVLGLSGTAHYKRIPSWVFSLPRELKLEFLGGYLDGDGTVRKDGIEFYSCNKWLLEDVRALCFGIGLRTGRIRCQKMSGTCVINNKEVNRNDIYVLRVYNLKEIISLDSKYIINEIRVNGKRCKGDGWIGNKVLKIEKDEAKEVFDIEVDGCESFIGEGYVLHNSRGSGKTYLLALLALTELITLNAYVALLGGSFEQSRRVHDYVNGKDPSAKGKFLDLENPCAPRWMLKDEPTQEMTLTVQGGRMVALTASDKSVRGPHPQRLRLDEVDVMERSIYDAATGQPAPLRDEDGNLIIKSNLVLSSTHQNAAGTFSYVMEQAENANFPVRTWCVAEGTPILTTEGEIPIEKCKNKFVLTRKGWKKCVDAFFMGNKSTIKIVTKSGKELFLTKDHLVASTGNSWVEAGNLTLGTPVFVGYSPTSFTNPMPSIWSNPGVFGSEFVSLTTMGCSFSEWPSSSGVLSLSNNIQMNWIAARPVSTNMINSHITINGSDQCFHNNSMGSLCSSIYFDDSVSISGAVFPQTASFINVGSFYNYVEGYFILHDEVLRLEEGEVLPVWDLSVEEEHEFAANGIIVHNCWRESLAPHGWMTAEDIELKRRQMPPHVWEREMEHAEPKAEGVVFDPEIVHSSFSEALKTYEGECDEEIIIEDYDGYSEYYAGADFAKARDYTVFIVFKKGWEGEPDQCVYFLRMQKVSYVYMANKLDLIIQRYNADYCYDATGPGAQVEDLLVTSGEGVHFQDKKGITRMLSNYEEAFKKGMFVLPRIKSMWREHLSLTFPMLYGDNAGVKSSKNHLPDTVCAAALALKARDSSSREVFMTRLRR